MGLRSLFRAVSRRWSLALALSLGTAALGLATVPGVPFTYTATARVTRTGGEPVAAAAVLERAIRADLGADFPSGTPEELARSLARLRAATSVESGKDFANVSCRSTRPERAVAMADAIARSFEAAAREEHARRSARALEAVDRRLGGPAAPASEDAALRLARARLAELEQARLAAELETADLIARIDDLARRVERGEAGPARAVETAESDRLAEELDDARRRLESARTEYPEDWPPVTRAAARYEELRARRDRALSREVLAARFAPVRQQIEELRSLSARRERLAAEEAPRAARIAELRKLPAAPPAPASDPETRRRLEARREELVLERDAGPAVRVAPAGAPSRTGHALPFILLAALAIGLAAALAAEALATTIRTEHDVRRYVNLPLLGTIPWTRKEADRVLLSGDPRAPLAEPFNTAGALLESRAREASARLFAVTSPSAGDGKSTAACNLALALARCGTRVLLVDADLRRAAQHRLFNLWNQQGLSSYLSGASDAIDGLIATTAVESLHLLFSGPAQENPAPLLRSERFRALLADLRGRYDLVLVDLPPAGIAADALLVAPLVDGVLLVLSAGETRKDAAAEAKRLIRAAGGTLAGCVLNKATVRSRGYYCYSAAPAVPAE